MAGVPNAAQAEYWTHATGPTWVEQQVPLDRQLDPLGRKVIEALALKPGERVLDVGCGAGATSLQLAEAVGPAGQVTGADISPTLLEAARGRATSLTNVAFVEADAQAYPFAAAAFDAIFSRFGVMFFADPTAAFTNLRRALKPGGRLGFVCWRTPTENPIMVGPMAAAAAIVGPQPPPADPNAPGPFAFADAARVKRILADAGFHDVVHTPLDMKIGGGDLEATLGLALKVGPLGALLREHPDRRDAVIDAVRAFLAAHQGPDGVKLDSATWMVTARNPG
jgi:SAM-dependent methyltransferase